MAVGLLLEGKADINEDQNELLTIIKEDSDKLDNLVGELLDLSKMKSGKIEMEISDMDINDVISQVKRAFKIQLEERNIVLNIDTNGILRKVKGDMNKISWVIANLIGNALRYTKNDGTGIIEIKAKEVKYLAKAGVKSIMIGAIVTGKEEDTIYRATKEFKKAIAEL